MNKPILCLDFDGVIHSYTSGWKGADVIPDPPVEGAIAFMLEALLHFDVMIFSSRSNQKGGVRAMNDWLYKHAGAAWYETPAGPGLESIGFVKEKPAAFVTIDDRAITFDGVWPDIEALKQFKPWNKRPMPLQDHASEVLCACTDSCAKGETITRLRSALKGMLAHSHIADSAAEDKDAEDHAAEREARAMVAEDGAKS